MISRNEAIDFLDSLNPSVEAKVAAISVIDKIYNSVVESTDSKDPWAWVKTEYVAMFKERNPEKGGHVRECVSRMKKMFAANPEMRKEDVLGTVKYYLANTNPRYIRFPHYFLKKGQGVSAIYEFETWYEKYLENKGVGEGRTSVTNTMK